MGKGKRPHTVCPPLARWLWWRGRLSPAHLHDVKTYIKRSRTTSMNKTDALTVTLEASHYGKLKTVGFQASEIGLGDQSRHVHSVSPRPWQWSSVVCLAQGPVLGKLRCVIARGRMRTTGHKQDSTHDGCNPRHYLRSSAQICACVLSIIDRN